MNTVRVIAPGRRWCQACQKYRRATRDTTLNGWLLECGHFLSELEDARNSRPQEPDAKKAGL